MQQGQAEWEQHDKQMQTQLLYHGCVPDGQTWEKSQAHITGTNLTVGPYFGFWF